MIITNKPQTGVNNHNHNQNNQNNNSNNSNLNDGNVARYELSKEIGLKNRLPNLRYHVFISKETTKELADYILPEPWGEENGLLYKYLDYVWRCQLFDGQVKKFCCRNEGKLVFHSGLQRRSDGEYVYLLLIRNDADSNKKVDQKWRVALGIQNGLHSRNMSFVTQQELMKHYWPHDESLLSQRTLFYHSEKDLLFKKNYRFEIDWEERLRTCKNRIYRTLSNLGNRKGSSCLVDEGVLPLQELQRRFESETVKSIALARANPRQGVPQAFIESKSGGYRLELLIPLTLYFRDRVYYFALALRPHHDDQIYEGMSILTREMAYANARLVGSIDSSWLTTRFANDNVGAAQHCSCTCHNFCNAGINADHVHNLSDHKRKYNNEIPYDPQQSRQSSTSSSSTPSSSPSSVVSAKNGLGKNKLQYKNNNVISPRHLTNANSNFHPHHHQQQQQQHHPRQQPRQQQQHPLPPQQQQQQQQQQPPQLVTPKLNRAQSHDSNPYMIGAPFNNSQIRNPLNQLNAPPLYMHNMPPLSMMNNMYPNSFPMQSPSYATSSNPNSRPVNTATTNPFQFVTPNPNTPLLAPYGAPAPNAYNNLSSLLSSAANNPAALNAAFLASVPNVAGGMYPLLPQAHDEYSTALGAPPNPLSFLTNASGIPSVGNPSLPPYGIPTIAPLCLGVSSVSSLPIAQMSGPQSIGSSVPSSVPLFAKSLALNANTVSVGNKTHSNSNSSVLNGVNGHPSSSASSGLSSSNAVRMNAALVAAAQNNTGSLRSAPTNSKNGVASSSEGQTENKQRSDTDSSSGKPPFSMTKIDTHINDMKRGAADGHDGVVPGMKRGFTDEMFADASPRTKEIFTGLTFDEEDEVYSLQPSRGKHKLQTGTEAMKGLDDVNVGGMKPEKNTTTNTLPKSKSFCLPIYSGSTTHDWKSASFGTLHDPVQPLPPSSAPESPTATPAADGLFLRDLSNSDGIQRVKSEHDMGVMSKRYGHTQSSSRGPYYRHEPAAPAPPMYYDNVMRNGDHEGADYSNGPGGYNPRYMYSNESAYSNMYAKKRMFKSRSQPSLSDMMQMQVGTEQFQQFQQMSSEAQDNTESANNNNNNNSDSSHQNDNERQHRHRSQKITAQPIQEDQAAGIMDLL